MRLQVDTLHIQWIVENPMSFLQLLQRFQRFASSAMVGLWHKRERLGGRMAGPLIFDPYAANI